MAGRSQQADNRPRDRAIAPGDAGGPGRPSLLRRLPPRPEMVLLIASLLLTIGTKLAVVRRQRPDNLLVDWIEAITADIAFFSAIASLLALLYVMGRRALVARLAILIAALVTAWSLLNAGWLYATGVQLQPGVLAVLAQDPSEFWPVVEEHLARNRAISVPFGLLTMIGGAWFLWRLIRPSRMSGTRRRHLSIAVILAIIFITATVVRSLELRRGITAYSGEVIGFSSHWCALVHIIGDATQSSDVTSPSRVLPRVGERDVAVPQISGDGLANVVIIFLESVSYESSSLGDPSKTTTPHLAELAREGVEFVSTHIPVPQTGKAWWAALTGCTPDLQPDYVEAVLVDRPYESLPSLLARIGYRSAFFEMSKGSFECAPGFFANLAFDWAWFRENLEDESAHLGYMNGDDFRMIEPMFEWVDRGEQPFLLTMITSVAHDPYELPAWYGAEPTDDRYERYLQTIRFGDAFLEAVQAELAERDLLDDTILCVIGDHGEGFRPESERGRWVPFEDLIRVPWIIRAPGRVQQGARIDWPCSQLDVTPTILSLLGFGIDDAGFDGRNALAPIPHDRRMYFSSWYRDSPVGYLQGDRKLIYWPFTDTLFEYDLATDPGERSPRKITGEEKRRIIADVRRWESESRMVIPARRFRKDLLYEHWRVFSDGRSAWAYYVP